jgi:hypothetical protein
MLEQPASHATLLANAPSSEVPFPASPTSSSSSYCMIFKTSLLRSFVQLFLVYELREISRAIIVQVGGTSATLSAATCRRSCPTSSSRMATLASAVEPTSSRIVSSVTCNLFQCYPSCCNIRLDWIVRLQNWRRGMLEKEDSWQVLEPRSSNENMRMIKASKNNRNERFNLGYSVLSIK